MSAKSGNPLFVIGSLIVGAALVGGVSRAIKNHRRGELEHEDELNDLDKWAREDAGITEIYDMTLRSVREGAKSSAAKKSTWEKPKMGTDAGKPVPDVPDAAAGKTSAISETEK